MPGPLARAAHSRSLRRHRHAGGARAPVAFNLAAGETRVLRFKLPTARLRSLRRAKTAATMEATAVTTDATADGVRASVSLAVAPPTR